MVRNEDIKKEHEDISKKLSDPELISNPKKLKELSQRYEFLQKVIEKIKSLEEIEKEISENEEILKALPRTKEEEELSALAESEIKNLSSQKKDLEKELEEIMKEKNNRKENEKEDRDVIMEIRAGVGGEEAAIFAGDLFRMYSHFAQKKGWKVNILDSHPSDIGGYKEVIFEVSGKRVFPCLFQESGVHRVQRIPKTEKSGRIHTSTVTVAVLSKPKSTQIKIDPKEIKIDVYRASGPGGQYVNKRDSAVRITYLPTKLVVTSQSSRTQLENRENALKILKARILEKKRTEELKERRDLRKSQIGTGERSEKIRTYNFPQNRITDHRLKKNWHNLESIMEGNLEPIIKAFSS